MHRIRILKTAADELSRLDTPVSHRIIKRINWLAANLDAIRLEGLTGDLAGLYKLRVGDYRVVYQILHEEQLVLIHAIGHRRDIYGKR